jgi:hypothetical protein
VLILHVATKWDRTRSQVANLFVNYETYSGGMNDLALTLNKVTVVIDDALFFVKEV